MQTSCCLSQSTTSTLPISILAISLFQNYFDSQPAVPALYPVSQFSFGFRSARTGPVCEIVAVCNAKTLIGQSASMADIALQFQQEGAMVAFGFFGSNPYSIGAVLEQNGITYSKVDTTQMASPGTYIVSFWNNADNVMEGIHTIAISYNGKSYTAYNRSAGTQSKSTIPQDIQTGYICGYYNHWKGT